MRMLLAANRLRSLRNDVLLATTAVTHVAPWSAQAVTLPSFALRGPLLLPSHNNPNIHDDTTGDLTIL